MPENLRTYIQKLKENLDRVIFVLFIILLVILAMNYLKEQGADLGPTITDRLPPRKLEDMLPNPQYEKVVAVLNANTDPDKASELKSLWEYNMFDYKTVRDRDVILKEYDKEYTKAEDLFNRAKYAEAKEIIDKILLHWPSHIKSRDLLRQIDAVTQKKPPEKPK
jgi:preprotein translocase subunit SecA